MNKQFLLYNILFLIVNISCKEIRWGLLSTARFNTPIIEAIRKSKHSIVAAVASRDVTRAKKYAQEHEIPTFYGSYEELIADPSIDVIFNPLPNSMHGEWTIKAAQAGKHVLCEKPLVTNLANFALLEKTVEENKVCVFEGLAYFYLDQTHDLLTLLKNKKIGDITQISGQLHINLADLGIMQSRPDSDEIRLNPQLAGGSLWDLGIYCASIILLIAQQGLPEEVYATTLRGPTGVDINAQCILKFKNNLIAHFSTSFYTPYNAGITISGTQGRIQLDGPWHPGFWDKNSIIITAADGIQERKFYPLGNPYINEITAMEDAILYNKQPSVTLELSKNFLRTILALYESAQSGIPVKVC